MAKKEKKAKKEKPEIHEDGYEHEKPEKPKKEKKEHPEHPKHPHHDCDPEEVKSAALEACKAFKVACNNNVEFARSHSLNEAMKSLRKALK
jgi:hypothetical protein